MTYDFHLMHRNIFATGRDIANAAEALAEEAIVLTTGAVAACENPTPNQHIGLLEDQGDAFETVGDVLGNLLSKIGVSPKAQAEVQSRITLLVAENRLSIAKIEAAIASDELDGDEPQEDQPQFDEVLGAIMASVAAGLEHRTAMLIGFGSAG